jgi:putative sigma-54 modulation protein
VEITVRGKHFEVPDSVEQHARRKLGKLDHYLPLLQDATVEVDIAHQRAKEPHERYLVRVLVSGRGVHLRAVEHAAELTPAVDEAARVVIDQARKHKERLVGRARTRPAKRPAPAPSVDGDAESWEQLTRVKRFTLKPMTLREAVDEMELLGHSFFLYLDADEDRFAVVFRRKSGDYGLIVPELS